MSYLLATPLTPPMTRHSGFVAAQWYPCAEGSGSGSSAVGALNTLYLTPFSLPFPCVIEAIGARVVTGAASGTVKFGIWRNRNGRPTGLPVASQNTGISTATSTSSPVTTGDLNARVGAGEYWAGAVFGTALPTMQHVAANLASPFRIGGSNVANAVITPQVAIITAFAAANDITALDLTGASFSGVAASQGPPIIAILIKSSP